MVPVAEVTPTEGTVPVADGVAVWDLQTSLEHVRVSVTTIVLVPVVTAVKVLAPEVCVVVPRGQVVVVYVRVTVEKTSVHTVVGVGV